MDLITISLAVAAGAAISAGTGAALVARKRIKRADDARRFALESVELVNGLLGAGSRLVAAGEIPADSEAGRALLHILGGMECGCPDHEEERRIRHAAEQVKRDGE